VFGNKIYVDIEIVADSSLPLEKAHQIAENVHSAVEESFTQVKHIMVHVNPK
ncbi:MAG: cation-efflux pump, partial [Ruminococcus sp.]|nr:cation-efflux pump [Ruminococcus sp.]